MDDSMGWKYFATKEDANVEGRSHNRDIIKNLWEGPGYYHIRLTSQRCPRGCCWDSVVVIESPTEVANRITRQMIHLADGLREARTYAKTPPTVTNKPGQQGTN